MFYGLLLLNGYWYLWMVDLLIGYGYRIACYSILFMGGRVYLDVLWIVIVEWILVFMDG